METLDFIEVKLDDPENFLKVKETLTRIGIANNKTKTLYQTAHILYKHGRYYIVHFKQMFALDGRDTDFDKYDLMRVQIISILLSEWNLVKLVNPIDKEQCLSAIHTLKIVPYREKKQWKLCEKYAIGNF